MIKAGGVGGLKSVGARACEGPLAWSGPPEGASARTAFPSITVSRFVFFSCLGS